MTPATREKIRAALVPIVEQANDRRAMYGPGDHTASFYIADLETLAEALALLDQEEEPALPMQWTNPPTCKHGATVGAPCVRCPDQVASVPPTPDVEAGRATDHGQNFALLTRESVARQLEGPHEWGYRDVTDGTFIADDTPFRAAALLRVSAPPEEGQPEGMETTAEERLSYATLAEERHKDRTDLTVVLGRFIQRLSRDINRLLAERDVLMAQIEHTANFAKAEADQRDAALSAQRRIEAGAGKLREVLTSASEVVDAMVIQFRNRDQSPPEPQLIQAGKIVLAAIRSALAAEGGETT